MSERRVIGNPAATRATQERRAGAQVADALEPDGWPAHLASRPMPVESDLARRLRQSRIRIANAIDQRDRLILEALEAGGSLREVGSLVGLTHAGVKDIQRRKGSS